MGTYELPVPLRRCEDAHGPLTASRSRFDRWNRDRLWNRAHRSLKCIEDFTPGQLALVDMFNALMQVSNCSHSTRATAYCHIALHVARFDAGTVRLWHQALKPEFTSMVDTDSLDELKTIYRDAEYFHFFAQQADAYREDIYYLDLDASATHLTNAIRLSGAKDRHGKPLVFEGDNVKLLYPQYRVYSEILDDRELLEAEGTLKLHYAWKTNDDSEQRKIKRFVTAHANEIDAAVQIIETRYVDTLEHLESLMEQAAAPVLLDGAL